MEDEWKKLYEKYEKRKRRIVNKILIVSIIAIAVMTAVVLLSPYMFSGFSSQTKENIYSILQESANQGSYKFQTSLPDTQCYWIRSTAGESGFVLEVREYLSPQKNCIGEFLNSTEIQISKPINLIGNDCICGKKICELENVLENNATNLKLNGC